MTLCHISFWAEELGWYVLYRKKEKRKKKKKKKKKKSVVLFFTKSRVGFIFVEERIPFEVTIPIAKYISLVFHILSNFIPNLTRYIYIYIYIYIYQWWLRGTVFRAQPEGQLPTNVRNILFRNNKKSYFVIVLDSTPRLKISINKKKVGDLSRWWLSGTLFNSYYTDV